MTAVLLIMAAVVAACAAGCLVLRVRHAQGYIHPSAAYRRRVYALMSAMDRICLAKGIPYWAAAGTLLGAVREGALIPWDDDLDIVVPETGIRQLQTLTAELQGAGLVAYPTGFGLRIGFAADPDGASVSLSRAGTVARFFRWQAYPYMDVYEKKDIGDRFVFTSRWATETYPKESVIHKNELCPLTRYRFGPIRINGPAHPQPYLTRVYGDWHTPHPVLGHSPPRYYRLLMGVIQRAQPAAATRPHNVPGAAPPEAPVSAKISDERHADKRRGEQLLP